MGTAEIHLATGFQNIIYDSSAFPADLKARIYDHLKTAFQSEWKDKDTEEQFIYKTRKKGFGPFKQDMWHLPADTRDKISAGLEKQFAFLFDKLKMNNTQDVVEKYVQPVDVAPDVPVSLK